MHNLTPGFILNNVDLFRGDLRHGRSSFDAVVLFVDTSGFTPLTLELSTHGRDGAEVLADILLAVFEPLVDAVYEHGGFIAGFAGDAFKAVFINPDEGEKESLGGNSYWNALAAAVQIQQHMATHSSHRTKYGVFDFIVRISAASGPVTWTVWASGLQDADQSSGYTFSGKAIEKAIQGEDHANGGELVVTQQLYNRIRRIQPNLIEGEQLAGEAVGYVNITSIGNTLRTSRPNVEITSPTTDATSQIAGRFYPLSLINNPTRGEFRPVYSLFINTARLPAPGSDDDFLPFLFQLLEQYGGYLCRIGQIGASDPGGTFLLFWGAPSSHENDLDRVLNFLLAFQDGLNVPMRAGLTHSVVFAGFVGSRQREEYTCHGSSVNQAARQMTKASWHQILLDAETADRAQERYITSLVGSFPLKGLNKPQQLFSLIGRQAHSGPRYHQSDFVGRLHDLEELQEAIQPIFNGQFAGITLIEGEAGIGKSRLVHEFLMMTDATQDVQIFVGQVDEILREAFNPFRYFLQRYFEQSPTTDDRRNRAWFEATLETLLAAVDDPDLAAELERTQSFLGALINLYWPDSLYEQVEPQLRRENTLAALKALLQAEARRKPLILLVEDGQWLDRESATVLERLSRIADKMPMAVLLTARPLADGSSLILPPESIHQIRRITPLSKAEIAELAHDYLGMPASDALVELLATRAEGNPFFAEQMLLYLQEQGLLVSAEESSDGTWRLVESTVEIEGAVPTDLQAVLVARLDRLTQEVKHVVQTAAVLGREFSVPVLSQMLRGDSTLDSKMLSAQESAVWNSVSELRYLFRHALLRDAAYEMQLRARLQELHLVAAQSYELVFDKAAIAPYYTDLVYHYRHANEQAQEARYALLAAERAAETHAVDDAITLYSRALELADPNAVEPRFELYIKRVELYDLRGMRNEQEVDLAMLESLSAQMAEPQKQAEVALLVSTFAENIGAYDRSLDAAERANLLAPHIPEIRTKATMQMAVVLLNRNRYVEAQTYTEEALKEAQHSGLRGEEAANLHQLGILRYNLGDYQAAPELCRRSLAIYRDLNDPLNVGRVLLSLGNITNKIDEYKETRYFDEARSIWTKIGYMRGRQLIDTGIGNIHLAAGRYDLAQRSYESSSRVATEVNDPLAMAHMNFNLAIVSSRTGRYNDAIRSYEIARQQYAVLGYRQGEAIISTALGNVEHARGNLQRSLSYFETGLSQLEDIGALSEMGDGYTSMGKTLFELGRVEEAQKAFDESLKIRRGLGRETIAFVPAVWLARIAAERGELDSARSQIDSLLEQQNKEAIARTYDPGRFYWVLYQTLDILQHRQLWSILQTAHDLLQNRASQIQDPDMARSYLMNVPAHRDLIAAFEKHKLS